MLELFFAICLVFLTSKLLLGSCVFFLNLLMCFELSYHGKDDELYPQITKTSSMGFDLMVTFLLIVLIFRVW